jgi:Trp operon repressor
MESDNPPVDARRRRMVNRRGMSFSGSSLARSSEGGGVADGEEAVEGPVEDLNSSVRAAVPVPHRMSDEAQSELARTITNSEEYTPQNRLAEVRTRSSQYEMEYRLQLIHRLLMRNIPLDEIARSLGVSVSTVMRDRNELRDRLRAAAKELDIEVMIGNSKGFYEEVQAMAMRAASSTAVPMPMRLAAMRTALASHNDMHRFYQAAGVYDVLRFRRGAADGAQTDIQRLMALTDELLTEARNQTRGEDPLGQFSGGDSENVTL